MPPPLPVTLALALALALAAPRDARAAAVEALPPHAVTSSVEMCPCTFVVTTERAAPPLDFLAVPHMSHVDAHNASLSHFRQSAADAPMADALVRHHVVHIAAAARFRLHVHASAPTAVLPPRTVVVAMPAARQGTSCPNRFPNNPGTDRAATTTASTPLSAEFANLTRTSSVKDSEVQPRIVGGQRAGPNLASYLVFLQTQLSQTQATQCTGTLVDRDLVITAAHCNVRPDTLAVISAQKVPDQVPSSSVILVKEALSHPRYSATSAGRRFDIAYARLEKPVPSTSNIMAVNVDNNRPTPSHAVRTAGYGSFLDGPGTNPGRDLHFVDVPVVSEADCKRAYGNDVSYDYQVCAGYLGAGGCDSCQGDSGGPLIQYDRQNKPVLVGVVSVGIGCATADFPGIYVRTSTFLTDDSFLSGIGLQRNFDAVQVPVDYTPPSKPNTVTIILAALGGVAAVVVLITVIFLVRKCCCVKPDSNNHVTTPDDMEVHGQPASTQLSNATQPELSAAHLSDQPATDPYVQGGADGSPTVAAGTAPSPGSPPGSPPAGTPSGYPNAPVAPPPPEPSAPSLDDRTSAGMPPPPPPPGGSAPPNVYGSVESEGPLLAFEMYDPYQGSRGVGVEPLAGTQPPPASGDTYPDGSRSGGAGTAMPPRNNDS